MKGYNFTFPKSISLVSILVLSIISVGFLLPQVIAEHGVDPGVTKPLGIGANIVDFRDTTNVMLQSSTVSVDTSTIIARFITIIVEEEDSNLDSTAIEVIFSSATSTASELEEGKPKATTSLFETGPDSGVFSGTITLSPGPTSGNNLKVSLGIGEITIIYDSEPQAVGRLTAELTTTPTGDGTVRMIDVLLTDDEIAGLNTNFRPVTHPVQLELLDGATLDLTSPPEITISFANAALQTDDKSSQLNMYYKPGPVDIGGLKIALGWEKVRDFRIADPSSFDKDGKTITSDVANTEFGMLGKQIFGPNFGIQTTEAQFMLAYEKGLGGGGGGGLVRPGLIVNIIAGAGLLAGGSGGGANPTFGDASLLVLENPTDGFGGIISEGNDISLDSTKIVQTGDTAVLRFELYENQGITNLERFRMFLNFEGENYDASTIDTHITYKRDGEITIVDPHEKIEKAEIEILQVDAWNLIVNVKIIFKNTFNTSILVDSWDLDRNSGKKLFPDVLEVVEPSILLADAQMVLNEPTPDLTLQVITETELTEIPVWIKSNALWWNQKQIDDSDFMAGIEYLIKKSLIEIDENDLSYSETSKETPLWISDVAGMWANDSITDEEFIDAMKWLITNGILQVQQ